MAYTRPPAVTRAGQGLKQTPLPPTQAIAPVVLDAEIATATTLGVVKIGANISVTPDGTISATGGGGGGPSYAFGVWTPALVPSPTGSITISIRNARYAKVGQLVTCTFDIRITAITGGSDDNRINAIMGDSDKPIVLTGLPFTSITDTGSVGSVLISYYKDFDKNVNYLGGTVIPASTSATMWYQQNPGQSLTLLIIDNVKVGTILVGTVTYMSQT
jgi:hypothetical protein